MQCTNVIQNILSVILGLLIVGAGFGGLSFLILEQLSHSPVKPSFPEVKKENPDTVNVHANDDGTYVAMVVYQGDLVLRDSPANSGKLVDKLQFQDTVIVTGKSKDGQWEQVRVESKGINGWIAAGNLKRAQ
jgi:Bacterial SH3 domain